MSEEGFSVNKVLLTTVITATVSGLIGWGLATYFERAKPVIIVTSVGFRGPLENQPLEVPQSLIALTTKSLVLESLRRFERFDKLLKVEQNASESIQTLTQAIESVESWNRQNGVSANEHVTASIVWPGSTVREHPLVREELVGKVVTAHIRAEDVNQEPVDIAGLQNSTKQIFPVFLGGEKQDRLIVYMGPRSMAIPIRDMPSRVTDNLKLFAESIARGSRANISFYSENFINQARADILELQKIRDQLREVLLPKSSLSAQVVLENRGKASTTFRPYFGLKLDHADFKGKAIVLAVDSSPPEAKKNPFSLTSGGFSISVPTDQAEGKNVLSSTFLPEGTPSAYVNVPGGQVATVTLVGMDALKSDAETIKKIYETKLLNARIVAYTADGSEVASAPAEFSQTIGQDERTRIAGRGQ